MSYEVNERTEMSDPIAQMLVIKPVLREYNVWVIGVSWARKEIRCVIPTYKAINGRSETLKGGKFTIFAAKRGIYHLFPVRDERSTAHMIPAISTSPATASTLTVIDRIFTFTISRDVCIRTAFTKYAK
jgi:hypothetical protein